MDQFHTQLRNRSTPVPQGNGREWKGMEIVPIHVDNLTGRRANRPTMDGTFGAGFGGGW